MPQQPSSAFADPIRDGAPSRGLFRGHCLKIIHWNEADGYATFLFSISNSRKLMAGNLSGASAALPQRLWHSAISVRSLLALLGERNRGQLREARVLPA